MIIAFKIVFVNIFSLQHNAAIEVSLTAEYTMHTLKIKIRRKSFHLQMYHTFLNIARKAGKI
ncbi:hypothetical protein [Bacillus spizizenii]|uniref:hypothetical protein n=1 Tax=Bacillus spizizenii TaxID=96241 RepID=UPI00092EC810|nr:hypothetical protein [Bacillus spizizenii]OWV37934.1 hypothetical protein CE489_00250 [Bacillus spizizenii]